MNWRMKKKPGGEKEQIVTLAFPLYAKLVHGFNTYGAAFALFRHDGRLSGRQPAGRALQLDGGGAGLRSEVPGPALGVVVMTKMVAAIYRIVPNRIFTRHRSCPERCSPAS